MTITITLPPATEERLRAAAEVSGKEVDTVVLEAVEARLTLAEVRLKEILSPVHEDFRKSGMSEGELDAFLKESLRETRAKRASAPGSSS